MSPIRMFLVLLLAIAYRSGFAAPQVHWYPEAHTAVFGDVTDDSGQPPSVETVQASARLIPENILVLVIRAGEPTLGAGGVISQTRFNVGSKNTSDVGEVRRLLEGAGVPLKSFEGVLLVTCFGARPLPSGKESLAKRLSAEIGLPVLSSTGQLRMGMGFVLRMGSNFPEVMPQQMVYSALAPSGSTRTSPLVIESATGIEVSPQVMNNLNQLKKILDSFQDAAEMMGYVEGDLRHKEAVIFPSVVGVESPLHKQEAIQVGWDRLGIRLDKRKVLTLIVPPDLEIDKGTFFAKEIANQLKVSPYSPNALVAPTTRRDWYEGKGAVLQVLADKLRILVFAPEPVEVSADLSPSEWLMRTDYSKWVVFTPKATSISYFDTEVEELREFLGKQLGVIRRPMAWLLPKKGIWECVREITGGK